MHRLADQNGLAAPGRAAPSTGGRRRGGDIRAAVLLVLAEQPRHGHGVIQEIDRLSHGGWSPGASSVYPVLQQLEDEGLITIDRVEGRRTARLTDAGLHFVDENRAELGLPWNRSGPEPAEETTAYVSALRSLALTARQVVEDGTPSQHAAAAGVLTDARKSLHALLAE